jgi:ketosteroid isomerase-like protein
MSQENIEIVRRSYAAFARGDLASDAEDHDPDLVTHRPNPAPPWVLAFPLRTFAVA